MYSIKEEVLSANKWIVEKGLVQLTWGNVSFCDREQGLVYIKPSGVKLSSASPADVSCVDFKNNLLSGWKCSVDTPTHLEIYKSFEEATCIIHTHSRYATIFAQAARSVPCLGTTHADYFYGDIPCIPCPTFPEVQEDYEKYTGINITSFYKDNNIDYNNIQACLIAGHAPFVWGRSIESALENAYVLEIVCEYAYRTLSLNSESHLSRASSRDQ